MCWGEGHRSLPASAALTSFNPTSPQGMQRLATGWPLATQCSLSPGAGAECMRHVSHICVPMTKQSRNDTASQGSHLAQALPHTCDLKQVILFLWMSVSPMAKRGNQGLPWEDGKNERCEVSSTMPSPWVIMCSLNKQPVHTYSVEVVFKMHVASPSPVATTPYGP